MTSSGGPLLTFVRNSWARRRQVTAEEVKTVRAKTGFPTFAGFNGRSFAPHAQAARRIHLAEVVRTPTHCCAWPATAWENYLCARRKWRCWRLDPANNAFRQFFGPNVTSNGGPVIWAHRFCARLALDKEGRW